ncbi:hypothetical protein LuPra_00949 [Luteitalea pratensis]|uniref:Uncharacterized protein n=1 Tax=Luteitalea pratensis TaxID=1855912 RepID=A0A143PI40_LUTPR|nr:hypothetical protein LuPra_00949 [Luteitalea pratensis]
MRGPFLPGDSEQRRLRPVANTLDRLKLDCTVWLPAHPPNPDRPLTKDVS